MRGKKSNGRVDHGRTKSVTFRLTAEERRMLDAVALAWGVSASDVIRMCVRKYQGTANPMEKA